MLYLILNQLRDLLRPRTDLWLENLALRQQIVVLQRTNPKPEISMWDRTFWVVLCEFWSQWRNPLAIVKPQTVIAWHRCGWRLWWKWKSRPKKAGRPRIAWEVIELIKKMSRENPNWGADKIQGELMKLDIWVSVSTVSRYMVKRRGRPTQNWKTFLRNHLHETAAIDFLTIPTIFFQNIYVFVVLSLDRRKIVHINVTQHPTSEWTSMQLLQAFPFDTAPRYIVRDRDKIYGEQVQETLRLLEVEEKVISARSPWQNGYCERVVGTLKRECLNHMIIFNENHLRRILKSYLKYYHEDRTHMGLDKDTPNGREVEPAELGPVRRLPRVGGLHSRYARAAA